MIGLLAARPRSKFSPPNSGGLIFTLLDSAEVGRLRNFNPHFGDEDHGVKRTLQRPALSIAAKLFTKPHFWDGKARGNHVRNALGWNIHKGSHREPGEPIVPLRKSHEGEVLSQRGVTAHSRLSL